MSYQSLIAKINKSVIEIFEEIGVNKVLRLQENELMYNIIPQLKPKTLELLYDSRNQTTRLLEMFLWSEVFAHGPKIFNVKQLDIEMLMQIDVNVPIEEYNQPFDTYIIQLPEDFCKRRSVLVPQAGERVYGIDVPKEHEPDFIVLHHAKECKTILFALFFNSGLGIKTRIHCPSGNLEDQIDKKMTIYEDSLETSKEEKQLSVDLLRAAINYSLLIDEIGVKCSGPLNPRYYDRLVKNKNKKNVNKEELRRHPTCYTLNQEVKLYRTVNNASDLPGNGGTLSPHHRRGHYRMQPCGPKGLERKRIRIPAVFVNSHLFLGKPGDTNVRYS